MIFVIQRRTFLFPFGKYVALSESCCYQGRIWVLMYLQISTAVMKRFPEAKFTAVGAFIFLRFFCPAIVAPDAEGLIASAPSKEMRRGLLLIAKVVQNLANNVLFGAKEPYMFPLNDFLTQNIYRVTTFLREISVCFSFTSLVVLVSDLDRFHQTSLNPPLNRSLLTLVLALLYIDSFMTTGTMYVKKSSFERERVPFALLWKSPTVKFQFWRRFANLLLTSVLRPWMSPGIDQLFLQTALLPIRVFSISCSAMLAEIRNLSSQPAQSMMEVKARYTSLEFLVCFANL
jgi:GTPase-activator protein for Ras-like GTPase